MKKEEVEGFNEFISTIKDLHAEINKENLNWEKIQKKSDGITNYCRQEDDGYAVDGIGDSLRFIQQKLALFVQEISTNENFNWIGIELAKALVKIIKRAFTEGIAIENIIKIVIDDVISPLLQ